MTRHSSYGCLLLFVYLLFLESLLLGAEARVLVEKNQLVVGKVGSPTSLKGQWVLNLLNEQGGEECKKKGVKCKKEGHDEVEENVFQTGNYIYTNSNP